MSHRKLGRVYLGPGFTTGLLMFDQCEAATESTHPSVNVLEYSYG